MPNMFRAADRSPSITAAKRSTLAESTTHANVPKTPDAELEHDQSALFSRKPSFPESQPSGAQAGGRRIGIIRSRLCAN